MSRARALSRDEVRAIDQHAISVLGVPSVVLMENAGANAAREILADPGVHGSQRPALVLCGTGNNGGDGFVVARHLRIAGRAVVCVSIGRTTSRTPDCALNAEIWRRIGGRTVEFEGDSPDSLRDAVLGVEEELARTAGTDRDPVLRIDGLLGTGFRGAVREPLATLLSTLDSRPCRHSFALDVPSGMDCDTGHAEGAVLRARLTLTFAANKRGFLVAGAAALTGEVRVCSIGVPVEGFGS